MANSNPIKNYGNKGGGRLGYTYEKDQLQRLRKIADRGIAMIEAIQRGKVTDKEVEKYKVIEKSLLKALDKLQPNKQQTDLTSLGKELKGNTITFMDFNDPIEDTDESAGE